MVLVRNQEWPPHFTDLRSGFGHEGANASQNRNGLYHELIGGIKRGFQEEHATKVLPPLSAAPSFGAIVAGVVGRGGVHYGAQPVLTR